MVKVSQTFVNLVFDNLVNATQTAEATNEYHITVKQQLEALLAEARFDGRINGKNDGEREAQARQLFSEEYVGVEYAARMARQADYDLAVAKLERDRLSYLVRVKELEGKAITAKAIARML